MYVPSELITTWPCVVAFVSGFAVSEPPSGSESFPNKVPVTGMSSAVDAASVCVIGEIFIVFIVRPHTA